MSKLQALQSAANEFQAESAIDMTKAQEGGQRILIPEGMYLCRLVQYIELGAQPQEYEGKAKPDALEFRMAFALYGIKEDGPVIVETFDTAMSQAPKSGAFRMFTTLNYKGTAKHFAQFLGEAFLIKIIHKTSKATGTVAHRIDPAGFLPAFDPLTKKPYDCPMPDDKYFKLFLWNKPTKEAWNDLFIEGTWDDGKSKNRIQEKILAAKDFAGSPLQMLLGGVTFEKDPNPFVPPPAPAIPSPAMPIAAPVLPVLPV